MAFDGDVGMTHIVRIVANRKLRLFQFRMIKKHVPFGPVKDMVDLDPTSWHKLRCSCSCTWKGEQLEVVIIGYPFSGTHTRSEQAPLEDLFRRLFQRCVFASVVHIVSPVPKLCIQLSQRPDGLFAWINGFG